MDYLKIKLQGLDKNGEEKTFELGDFKGGKVVLYFYPKDNTPGCTQEACDFRDNFNRLTGKATVIGVSPDSIKSHTEFQKDHELNFILLSDPDHKLAKAFDVWQDKITRSTFLLNENSEITKEWRNVTVKGHVDEVLEAL